MVITFSWLQYIEHLSSGDIFSGPTTTCNRKSITKLNFTGYTKDKIKSYDYLKPVSLKKSIVEHFYPLFFTLKSESKELEIKIKLDLEEINLDQQFSSDLRIIKISELPELEVVNEAISPEPMPGTTIGLEIDVLLFCQM